MVDTVSDPLPAAIETKLILASRVEDTPVFNREGERIGHIADLSIDRVTGEVVYAIMSFGGFLGIGRRFHPLPWSLLTYDPAEGGYVVQLDKQVLADAPHYDVDELRELGGPALPGYGRVVEYYGPYGTPLI
jgi:hypothetical protein